MSNGVLATVQALDGGAAVALATLVTVVLARPMPGAHGQVQARMPVITIALALGAWFGMTSAIATAGGFSVGTTGSLALPLFGLALVVPLAIGVATLLLVAPIRRLLSTAEVQPALIAVHSLRVIEGTVFLALAVLGVLPAVFAVPAGVGDFLVGLVALPASAWLRSGRRGLVLAWNLLGTFDLVNAIVLGVASTPGPLHLIDVKPGTAWLLMPPLTVVPTFVVPLYLLLHFVSLRFLTLQRNRVRSAASAKVGVSA